MGWNVQWARAAKDFSFDAGAVVLALAVLSLLGARLPRRKVTWATALLALLLAFFCVRGNVETALGPLEKEAAALTAESRHKGCHLGATPVVVLSGGAWSDEMLTESSLQRVLSSVKILQTTTRSPRVFLFSGGFNDLAGGSEAQLMARYFRVLTGPRIDDSRVLLETQSQNTYENALFTRSLMDGRRLGRRVVLVTSSYHLPRSVATFRKAGFDVCPWAAPSPDLRSVGVMNFFNARNMSRVLNEYMGILGYWAKGWI